MVAESPPAPLTARSARFRVGIAIAEVAVSTGVGAAVSLVSTGVGLGVVAGLVTLVVGLLIDLHYQISSVDLEAQAALSTLAPIRALSQRSPGSLDFYNELARAELRHNELPIKSTVFDLELSFQKEVLLERYVQCAQGALRVELRPAPVIRETDGVAQVKSELLATSVVSARDYWDTSSGLSYLNQQEELLKSGVNIRRVFIEERRGLPELHRVVERHLEWVSNPEYRIAFRIALIGDVDSDLVEDYAIVDKATLIRLEAQRGLATAVSYETKVKAIDRAAVAFERLWVSSYQVGSIAALAALP